jgi:arylsulfatase A-like enzyme
MVPFIMKWPGRIQPGKSNAMVNQIDFIASFASLLDVALDDDQAIDSRNVLPALLGKSKTGHAFMIEEAGRRIALRHGPWKYIQGKAKKTGELYNLDSDVGEQKNVARENDARVKEMRELLQKLIETDYGVRSVEGQ